MDELEVIFVDGVPQCPCGSHLFETTFQMIKDGWLFEWASCAKCGSTIKITPEFEKFVREQKWAVKA